MTRVQQLEVRRFTKNMWSMLRSAGMTYPRPVDFCDIYSKRTANILQRRGFLTVEYSRGYYHARLTDAGLEVISSRPEDRRLPPGQAKYWGGAA
jgi:hypothetical protein